MEDQYLQTAFNLNEEVQKNAPNSTQEVKTVSLQLEPCD